MKTPLNDFHSEWIEDTMRAMAERPSATRQDLIQQTQRLEKVANGVEEQPAPETLKPCSGSTVPREKVSKATIKQDKARLSAALAVVGPAHQGKEEDDTGLTGREQQEKWRSLRRKEERLLREWLKDENNAHLRIDGEGFQREWEICGNLGGCEHDVWPTEDGERFMKRTQGLLHVNWREYLRRLELSNQLFPATPFRLEGFGNDPEGHFCTYVSQPAVYPVTRGVSRPGVAAFMFSLGFKRLRPWDFGCEELRLLVEDLHDQNVLYGPGRKLFVIDPIIYLLPKPREEEPEKRTGKQEETEKQHTQSWDCPFTPAQIAYNESLKRSISKFSPKNSEELIANIKLQMESDKKNQKPRDAVKKV